jgi:cytochrome b561
MHLRQVVSAPPKQVGFSTFCGAGSEVGVKPGKLPLHYTRTALALHWSMAGLVLAAVFMGWTMTEMAISPARLKLFNYHKWVGVTILLLAIIRVSWRATHAAPALVPMPRWQQILAHAGHAMLYLLLCVVPVSGWIYSNASGYPVVYLGKLPLPNLVERNRELAAQCKELHELLATALVALVVLHVLAALQHHFLKKDDTLRRMFAWHATEPK